MKYAWMLVVLMFAVHSSIAEFSMFVQSSLDKAPVRAQQLVLYITGELRAVGDIRIKQNPSEANYRMVVFAVETDVYDKNNPTVASTVLLMNKEGKALWVYHDMFGWSFVKDYVAMCVLALNNQILQPIRYAEAAAGWEPITSGAAKKKAPVDVKPRWETIKEPYRDDQPE